MRGKSKINKILLLFLSFLILFVFGSWQFVQSTYFAKILTSFISQGINQSIGGEFSFSSVEMQFFPPGVNIFDVAYTKTSPEYEINIKAQKTGLYFNVFRFLQNKITLKEILIEDGYTLVKTSGGENYLTDFLKKKEGGEENKTILNPLKMFKELEKDFPVKIESLNLKKIHLGLNQNIFNLRKLFVKSLPQSLLFELDIFNLSFLQIDPGFESFQLDQLEIKAILDDELIDMRSLRMFRGVEELSLSGGIQNWQNENRFYNLKYDGRIGLKIFDEIWPSQTISRLGKGLFFFDGEAVGELEKIEAKVKISLKDFNSQIISGDSLDASAVFRDKTIIVESLELSDGEARVALMEPVSVYNFSNKELLPKKIRIQSEGLNFKNALSYTGELLDPIKGALWGEIGFTYENKALNFHLDKGLVLRNFKLSFIDKTQNEFVVLSNPSLSIEDGLIAVGGGNLKLDLKGKIGNSPFETTGEVGGNRMNIGGRSSALNFLDLGNLAGLDMKGEGELDFLATGPLNDIRLQLKPNLRNSFFLGFELGENLGDMELNFRDKVISINSMDGRVGISPYQLKGFFNYENRDIGIDINLPRLSYPDFKRIHWPLINDLSLLPQEVLGNFDVQYKLRQKGSKEGIAVYGEVNGKSITIEGEIFDQLSSLIVYEGQKFQLSEILLKKKRGQINGWFDFDLQQKIASYQFDLANSSLSDFENYRSLPLALEGNLQGSLKGSRLQNENEFEVLLGLTQAMVDQQSVPDSSLKLNYKKELLDFSVSIMGNIVNSSGVFNLKDQQSNLQEKSFLDINFNITDLNIFAKALINKNINAQGIQGSFVGTLNSDFDWKNLGRLNATGVIQKFSLKKDSISLESQEAQKIVVKNGEIKNWNLSFSGENISLGSKGEGDFFSSYKIENRIDLDASIFEIFHARILEASGALSHQLIFENKGRGDELYGIILGDNLKLNFEGARTLLQKGKFKATVKDNRISLESFETDLSAGRAFASGEILFQEKVKVNITYELDDGLFVILDKTYAVASGRGAVLGEAFPYTVTGNIFLDKVAIGNEPKDFKNDGEVEEKFYRFIPQSKKDQTPKFFVLDMKLETAGPILIANSLAEMALVGDLFAKGDPSNPRINGRLSLVPGLGKAFMKNNEFIIQEGFLQFTEGKEYTNPDLDFSATTTISEVDIKARLQGDKENFTIDLSSEPPLPQNDILSLIAFGYTQSLGENLSEEDRNQLSSAGIGSLIVDQFKINETLKSNLGLQVNVGTEIQENTNSPLLGRNSGTSNDQVGRIQSATKVELRKQITKSVDLSVSSTIGGSIGQKQSMNLGYDLGRNVGVEGVYELRTADEGNENIIDNTSIGGDVKFRWKFK